MANQFTQDAPVDKYSYQRYPLVVHRGEHPNIESRHCHSEADEADAIANGWSTVRPPVPEPEQEKPVLTLEERVAALEATVTALITPAQEPPKRGPGRPAKVKTDE